MSRPQRRAVAAKSASSFRRDESESSQSTTSAPNIPLARPSSTSAWTSASNSGPQAETLYQIVAARQAKLVPRRQPFSEQTSNGPNPGHDLNHTSFVTLNPDGKLSNQPGPIDGTDRDRASLLHSIVDTLFLSASLSSLHFTLSFLTLHQYAQQDVLSLPDILRQTLLTAFPALTLLIHVVHGHALPVAWAANSSPGVRVALKMIQQLALVFVSNLAGCYLIYLTNDRGYYAVMKRAPAIGTLWVWSVIELGLIGALVGVIGPGLYAWWNGYGVW
jgi:hypothetical protein